MDRQQDRGLLESVLQDISYMNYAYEMGTTDDVPDHVIAGQSAYNKLKDGVTSNGYTVEVSPNNDGFLILKVPVVMDRDVEDEFIEIVSYYQRIMKERMIVNC